jgi:phosphate-selective porin OprO/OprP
MNINYDPRLQFRIGRFKTPFTYEFFHEPIQGLINPERSLFFNNFALNRTVGGQVWGQLFDRRLDYAAGIFNTSRNAFLDTSDGKDFLGYLGFRPFQQNEDSILQFLEVGGSVDVGNQVNVPVPAVLRTNVATTGNTIAGVPFLAFNSNVRESGQHAFWSPHVALYRNHLSLIAEYQAGFSDYTTTAAGAQRTSLPIQSYYVQAGYFITGETVTNRNIVKPINPFNPYRNQFGLGAIELAGRFNTLNIGQQVFSAGLSDQNLWSRSVNLIDLGVNWYPTQFTKIYAGWQHADFGAPVQFAPGRRQLTSDMFWVRFQLFF